MSGEQLAFYATMILLITLLARLMLNRRDSAAIRRLTPQMLGMLAGVGVLSVLPVHPMLGLLLSLVVAGWLAYGHWALSRSLNEAPAQPGP